MATEWIGTGNGVYWEDSDNWTNGYPGQFQNDSIINFGSVICISNNSGICTLGGGELTFVGGVNGGTVIGSTRFDDGANNSGTVTGNAIFNGTSYNVGTVNLDATFNDFSFNDGNIVGNATFNNSSHTDGAISSDATFNDTSYNQSGGTISGDATFYDASFNLGSVAGKIILPWLRVGSNIESTNTGSNFNIRFADVPEGGGGDILGAGLL